MNQLKTILPENIDWKPFAAPPPLVSLAVIVGQPSEPGPYVIRVKVPAGVKLIVLPGNTSHFHWAKSGEYVAQVTTMGPLCFEYVNSKDDPRNETSAR